jgi:hypothetical protein
MKRFQSVLASLMFAAHALVGCGAHQACQYSATSQHDDEHTPGEHAHHDCGAHDGESSTPCDHESSPAACDHEDCSYLKVNSSQADVNADLFSLAAFSVSVDECGPQVAVAAFEPDLLI